MHLNQCFDASGSVVFVNFDKVEVWRCVAFQCGMQVARPRRILNTGNTIFTWGSSSSHVPISVLSLVRALSFLVPTSTDLLLLSELSLFLANLPHRFKSTLRVNIHSALDMLMSSAFFHARKSGRVEGTFKSSSAASVLLISWIGPLQILLTYHVNKDDVAQTLA
jgi:hypothetical protein